MSGLHADGLPDFAGWAQGGLRGLRAYDPGHDIVALRRQAGTDGLLEAGSNENAWGPSPTAVQAFHASAEALHRYPDPLGQQLRTAIAASLSLAPAQVLLGNGSHELLMQVAQAFAGPAAGVVASQYGFAVYAIAAQAAGAPFRAAPAFGPSATMPRGHDLAALADSVDAHADTRVVYLANPNNPTGTWFDTVALESFLARIGGERLVVIDEAYLEYVTDPALTSAVSLLSRHPNLLVTRTFSKAHGLAGLRVGYACAHPALLAVLERLRESFNVNGPALAATEAALADEAHLAQVREANARERMRLGDALRGLGLAVGPSQANFLLVDLGRDASALEEALLRRRVVPRPMRGYGLPHCLRLTVGLPHENDRLLSAVRGALGEAPA